MTSTMSVYQNIFLVNILLITVPVNVDEVVNKGYTEQRSRVRTIAGTAEGKFYHATYLHINFILTIVNWVHLLS